MRSKQAVVAVCVCALFGLLALWIVHGQHRWSTASWRMTEGSSEAGTLSRQQVASIESQAPSSESNRAHATGVSDYSGVQQSATPPAFELVAIWECDQQPAPHIGLTMQPLNGDCQESTQSSVVTGADGHARVFGISPGEWTVSSDTGACFKVQIASGETNHFRVPLPCGDTIRGVVVDDDGRPVSGAAIWTGAQPESVRADCATYTTDKGEFELLRQSFVRFIGARADGYVASCAVYPGELKSKDNRVVRLVLHKPAATIEGVVRDASGTAIMGASVRMDCQHGVLRCDGQRPNAFPLSDLLLTTSESGTFRCACVEPGDVPVSVRCGQYALWAGSVSVLPCATERIEITLDVGCGVFGTVRTANHEIAAGVRVTCSSEYGRLFATAVTNRRGQYRLEGLPAGMAVLTAESTSDGQTSTSLELHTGERSEWSPDLIIADEITGTVVGGTGEGLPGLTLAWRAIVQGRSVQGTVASDDAGKFAISARYLARYDIAVYDNESTGTVLAEVRGVTSKMHNLAIRVHARSEFVTRCRARIVNEDGNPLGDVQAELVETAGSLSTVSSCVSDSDGNVEVLLPPGHLVLTLEKDGYTPSSMAVDIPEDVGIVELGRLELVPGGTLRVLVVWRNYEGLHDTGIRVSGPQDDTTRYYACAVRAGYMELNCSRIGPGEYKLEVMQDEDVKSLAVCRVQRGEETFIRCEVQ